MLRSKVIRLVRGLKQRELSELTGISHPDICRFEQGRVNLTPAELQRIANVFGISQPERLLDLISDPGEGLEWRIDGPNRDQP